MLSFLDDPLTVKEMYFKASASCISSSNAAIAYDLVCFYFLNMDRYLTLYANVEKAFCRMRVGIPACSNSMTNCS